MTDVQHANEIVVEKHQEPEAEKVIRLPSIAS